MKTDREIRKYLKEVLGLEGMIKPRGKVFNPLVTSAKGFTNCGQTNEILLETKFNINTHLFEDQLYFTETLPLFIKEEEVSPILELSNYVSMISPKDLTVLIEDKKLYDKIIEDLKEGTISIFKFYIDVLFTREMDKVYSMYASEFLKIMCDTSKIDNKKSIILTQCVGNEDDRVFPTTHLLDPSRGLIMSIRLNDSGYLDEENKFELEYIDYVSSLCYVLRSLILIMDARLKGIDYFVMLAPIKELVGAAKGV